MTDVMVEIYAAHGIDDVEIDLNVTAEGLQALNELVEKVEAAAGDCCDESSVGGCTPHIVVRVLKEVTQ